MAEFVRSRSSGAPGGGGGGVIVTPSDSDATVNMGTETESMGLASATTSLPQGTETASMAMVPAPTLALGTETASMGSSNAASVAAAPQGSDAQSSLGSIAAATTRDQGAETDSFQASAAASVNQFTSAAINNRNAGSTDWTTPANAQGNFDGTEAAFVLAAGLALTTGDADLRCTIPAINATPAGFTRTAIFISIRYRWDLVLTLPLVDTAHIVITLRDSVGVLIATLKTRTEDDVDNNQATLLTEDYDITALVTAPQLAAGLQVWVNANASLSLTTSGNMSCQVDGVHLKTTYSRTGIT